MNWAKERAKEIVSGISDVVGNGRLHKETVAAMAAALQRVADECADMANERIIDYVGTLAEYACAKVRNDIRARFPKGDA